jgi:hypothetical protein
MGRAPEQRKVNLTESDEYVGQPVPRSKTRAIVSVAFNRDEFDIVAIAAEQQDKKVSEYIRDAAVGLAERNRPQMQMLEVTGTNAPVSFAANVTHAQGRLTTRSRNNRAIAAASG